MELLKKRFEKDSNLVARKVIDEMILVPVTNKVYDLESAYVLDEVGARVWELIDGQRSIEDIKNVLLDEYASDEKQIEEDVCGFISQLEKLGGIKEIA